MRTVMQVVSDIRKHVQTVELDILVDELVFCVAELQAKADAERERKEANRERMASVRAHKRCVQHTETQKENPPHPLKKNNILNKNNPPTPLAEPLFDEFWGVYPLKVGKGAARKAFRHALTRASHAEILAGAKRYAASKPEPKFTAHPTTWLNADRWADEAPKVVQLHAGPRWTDVRYEYEQKYGKADALAKYTEDLQRGKSQ